MRPIVLVVLLLAASPSAFAQTGAPLVVERVRTPFVIAPDYKVTDLDGELGQLAGAYAGRVIEDSLFIGAAGYWLANGSGGDDLKYGGLVVGWSMPAAQRLRFGARGLVGVGTGTLGTNVVVTGQGARRDARGSIRFGAGGGATGQPATLRVLGRDDFFVVEPQADLLMRLTRHLALHWAAGYRLTALTDRLDDRLDGATGSVGLQLEW